MFICDILASSLQLSKYSPHKSRYICTCTPLGHGLYIILHSHVILVNTIQGRDGKGSIFVWANGNGGRRSDDCAADGYASSIYTISIGAVSVNGTPSPFDERCSAKMTVTYVTNLSGESEVVSYFERRNKYCSYYLCIYNIHPRVQQP